MSVDTDPGLSGSCHVTNLRTGRKTYFRSSGKLQREATQAEVASITLAKMIGN